MRTWADVEHLNLGGDPQSFVSCLDHDLEIAYGFDQDGLFSHPMTRPRRNGPLGFMSWIVPKGSGHAIFYELQLSVDNYQVEGVSTNCYYQASESEVNEWTDERFDSEYPHLAYSC